MDHSAFTIKEGFQDHIDLSLSLHSGEGDFFAFIIAIDSMVISTVMTSSPTIMCE
jgi:hypothetical protein